MGIGTPCCDQNRSLGTSEDDVDALIAAAETFQQQVSVLDGKVKEIRDKKRSDPSSDAKDSLKKLQKQKEKLVDETVASLRKKLSDKGAEKLSQHINERVKRKVKYTPTDAQ
jgi:F0F1-type ATP synthase delta subunit